MELKNTKNNFKESCYKNLKKVPKGKVITYKILAESLNTKAYRAVGTAMKNNPYAPNVPCHRVIKSNGEVGEFVNGKKEKIRLLKSEGVEITQGKVNLKKYQFKF